MAIFAYRSTIWQQAPSLSSNQIKILLTVPLWFKKAPESSLFNLSHVMEKTSINLTI